MVFYSGLGIWGSIVRQQQKQDWPIFSHHNPVYSNCSKIGLNHLNTHAHTHRHSHTSKQRTVFVWVFIVVFSWKKKMTEKLENKNIPSWPVVRPFVSASQWQSLLSTSTWVTNIVILLIECPVCWHLTFLFLLSARTYTHTYIHISTLVFCVVRFSDYQSSLVVSVEITIKLHCNVNCWHFQLTIQFNFFPHSLSLSLSVLFCCCCCCSDSIQYESALCHLENCSRTRLLYVLCYCGRLVVPSSVLLTFICQV